MSTERSGPDESSSAETIEKPVDSESEPWSSEGSDRFLLWDHDSVGPRSVRTLLFVARSIYSLDSSLEEEGPLRAQIIINRSWDTANTPRPHTGGSAGQTAFFV